MILAILISCSTDRFNSTGISGETMRPKREQSVWTMSHATEQLTRMYIRPTELEKEFSFLIFGQEVDFNPLLASREALIAFVKGLSNRSELEFGQLKWVSEWRSVP